jgi:hypothetical protein
MPDNTSDRTQPPADGDNRRTSVPPDPDTHTRPTPVASGATTHTEKTVTKRNRSNLVLGIVGALVVAALLIVAITSGFIRFGTPDAQQPTNVEQLINDAVQKAKDADKATFDKAQKEAADKAAELRAEIDRLKKQPATGGSGTSTVGNADGAGTPTADAAQTEINRDTFRKIIQENGQREGEDYRFNIDRDLAARVNPGVGVFGKPIFNEQELVSSLGDGSATSERALKALQDKQLEKNGLTVSRQNLLDARNYVCVQQLKPNKSNDMAYVAADGSIAWDNKLVDPAYSVNCAYVGPEVRAALASGKKVTAIGKRGACLNTEEMPVTVNETPTLPLLETPVTPYKPTTPIITVVNKTKIEICELLTKKIITINKDEFDATKHTTDLSKCKEVPVKIQVCELKTKTIVTINKDQFDSTEHTTDLSKCEDKPEKIQVCELSSKTIKWINKDQFDATKHTTDLSKCEDKPEKIQVCELSSKTIKMINKDEFDATKHTTDLSKCKPVEECKPGEKPNPNPNSPHKCLEIKDEAQLPENNDNAPHNGTLMPDPGPATPPAVPKSDAPVVPTTPAVPEPVKVPRETEVPIVNEGAPVTAPVTGVTDSTTCAVCGGGMSEPAQAAPVAAPVAAVVQAAPVAATQPAVAAPAVVKEAAPVVAAPAAAAPAPVATQVASAPAVTDASVQVASAPVVSDASAQTATAPAVAVVATSVTTAAG